MEAVPRLPMLSFDLKSSPDRPPTEFSRLKQYIRDYYNEDPETFSTEIRNIETLRAQAVHPIKDVNGCSILKKYFCLLHTLESRFPLSKDGPAAIEFAWKDVYSGTVCSGLDIKYEMVAILYNIGALHSQLGASEDRTSPEGLKMACTHFQCAAWAFQHIKDCYAQPSGMDLSPDLMQYMYQLSLAQAQECILEKSMTDNRKATINARVATQIVDYYNLAQNALIQGGNEDSALVDVVGSKLMKSWKKYVRFKATYYTCVSLLYQGMQAEEQQKMGERVAYFQAAFDKLNEALKSSKGLDQSEAISESLMFTRDVVECKRKAAKSENEFIYHEEVVDVDSLPSIKGASLVKGISFNINDPDISGPDIFARLVPMKAHEASSLYSEEKAKLLRKINGLIDAKDEEVVRFMSCLQLDHLKAHLEPNSLPQEVVDRCAALSVKPDAIPNLISAMDKLNDAYHDVDAMLLEIMELIKIEEKNEKEYQEIMGSRAPSIVATDLTREANKYMEAHKKAADSNETLNRAMSQHVENLRVLQQSLPELQAQLPTLTPLKLEDNDSLREVTMLVGKVEEMRKQRAMLASQLRESICSDDITTILVTRNSENLETLFEDELKKHDKYVKLIEQNLSAQENILNALTDAYARYAPTRKATAEIIKQRELMLSALVSSYDAYEDLIAKSSKGMEFYRKLETNLTKLLQRVKGTCKVQQEEREAILAKNNVKISHDPVILPEPTSSGPKLKDYLQKRKEAQAFGNNYPTGYAADQGQNWLPGVRPPSVGSEVAQSKVSSTNPLEFTPQVGAYAGVNSCQQPYSPYPTPYGQPPYQPPLSNLQYPSLTDQVLSADSIPTAPYRPDSRASTSSDHSASQQQMILSNPVALITPSSDTRLSPISNSDNLSVTANQPSVPFRQERPKVSASATGQELGPPSYYPHGSYSYQGYAYPGNYNPYANQNTSHITHSPVSNPYPVQQPNTSTSALTSQMPGASHSQITTPNATQPSNVSVIQINSGGTQPHNYVAPNLPPNIQYTHSGVYVTPSSSVITTTPLPIPPMSQPINSGTAYDPSHAKAMSVPSASYNGPYGSNTITSPYANYYTSQICNGNLSSIATDKTAYPNPPAMTSSQPNVSVYDNLPKTQSNNVPMTNNQIPTTTYTVPANQQFSATNHVSKIDFSSTKPYSAPSLVSPTQTTYNILSSGQANLNSSDSMSNNVNPQNPYPPPQLNAAVVSGKSDLSQAAGNATKTGTATQYSYQPSNLSYVTPQYYNQQAGAGYTAQYTANYSGTYIQPQLSYPSGQTNQSTSYGTGNQSYATYLTQPTSYPQSTVPVTSTVSNAVAGNISYTQNHLPSNYPQTQQPVQHQPSLPQTQLNYPQNMANYNKPNQASSQQTQSIPQQTVNYITPSQTSNYVIPQQSGMVYNQQSYNYSGQIHPTGHSNYPASNPSSNLNAAYPASNVPSNNVNQINQTPVMQPTEPKSYIDLLTGLDFNVSEAPLQPLPQPTPVKQLSNSLSGLNIDDRTNTDQSTAPVNGEPKPKVALPSCKTKQEEKTESVASNIVKSEDQGSKHAKDPFTDADALSLFVQEVDKFGKFVEGLCAKTLSGPTPLDIKWNELQDLQEKDGHKQNISVARCYPMKNRFPDILPYDNSAVELPSTKDDYINASFVKDMCAGCPNFILTQAPLPSTYCDFWTMILEHHVELVVCLLSNSQLEGELYWPLNKGEDLILGQLKVSLQSHNSKSFWDERVISVSNSKSSRCIVHLQFMAWPNSWFPESPGPWLQLVAESLSVWRGCRNPESSVVVHCDSGVGRSGLYIVTAAALSEMLLTPHIPDIVQIAANLAKWRKNPLRDRDHLKFGYQIILYYCQDILMKRGILSSKGTFEEKRSKGKSHTRHPSQDFLLNSTNSVTSEERRHSDASSTGSRMSELDPLNQLDPLWQIKRHS